MNLTIDEFSESLKCNILLFHAPNFLQKLIRKYGDVREINTGGFHDVDDLRRDHGPAYNLLDRELSVGRTPAVVCCGLDHCRAYGLKKSDFFSNFSRRIACTCKSKRFR